jgi:site-specific DNA-cytosine methylase
MKDPISAVDLFCGVGGLSYGLQQAGISVVAGVDVDTRCAYPFEQNIDAPFLEMDVRDLTAAHLKRLWTHTGYLLVVHPASRSHRFGEARTRPVRTTGHFYENSADL